jgi:hypothetical protein
MYPSCFESHDTHIWKTAIIVESIPILNNLQMPQEINMRGLQIDVRFRFNWIKFFVFYSFLNPSTQALRFSASER